MLFEAWSSAPASVETACLPAGCGLGQIKSLIHEGGWEEEGGNGKVEQMERREGKKKHMGGERRGEEAKERWRYEWRRAYEKAEGKRSEEEDKNDPIDRLYPGSRIDVHLSAEISPTNHNVTSTGQYHTLQASSSHARRPLCVCTPGPPLLLDLINPTVNHKRAHHTWVKPYLWTNFLNLFQPRIERGWGCCDICHSSVLSSLVKQIKLKVQMLNCVRLNFMELLCCIVKYSKLDLAL